MTRVALTRAYADTNTASRCIGCITVTSVCLDTGQPNPGRGPFLVSMFAGAGGGAAIIPITLATNWTSLLKKTQ